MEKSSLKVEKLGQIKQAGAWKEAYIREKRKKNFKNRESALSALGLAH